MENQKPEKYTVRSGTKNDGFNYEIIILLQISLHLLALKNIKQFQVSCNNLAWGDFDDVVFEISLDNGACVTLAIQLKHTNRNMQIKHFQQVKHDFSLDNYFKTYKSLSENKFDLANVYFILYTTARCPDFNEEFVWQKNQLTQKICQPLQYLQNKGKCFQFNCPQENPRSKFLSQLFLYTNQLNYEKTFGELLTEMEVKFGSYQSRSIIDQFVIVLNRWKNGDFGGNYKISQNEFILEFCELLFKSYILEPTYSKYDNFTSGNLWNKIIRSVDVTIIDNISTLSLVWFLILEKIEWQKFNQLTMTELQEFLPKHYLLKKQKNNRVSHTDLYIIFWKTGLVPLILLGDNKADRYLSKIISLAKHVSSTHFIVCTKNTEPYRDLSTFTNISDLSRKSTTPFKEILKNVLVKIQNRFTLSLEEMYTMDNNVLLKITPDLLLDMMAGKNLGGSVELGTIDIYVDRKISSIYLHIKQLTLVINENFYVLCNLNSQFHVLKNQFPERVVEFSLDEASSKDSHRNIVLVEESMSQEVLQNFLKKLKVSYYLFQLIEYFSEYFLKLIEATGPINWINIADIKNSINDSEILSLRDKMINVISAPSGMGKTILLHQIYKTYSEKIWVVKINLQSVQFESDISLDYLFTTNCGSDVLTKIGFDLFAKKRQVIFLFDGFDELETDNIEKCLEMFDYIRQKNIIQWITTRPARSVFLENKFHILPYKINVLNDNDKEIFFDAYREKYIGENLKEWFKDTISHISKSLDVNLTNNPLHIYMICELIKNFTSNPTEFDRNNILLLYEKFIEMKLRVYEQKYCRILHRNILDNHLKSIHLDMQHCSLITVFTLPKIRNSLVPETNNCHEQCGIISHINNGIPIFVHSSFAEYFAAFWFAENWKKAPSISLFVEIYFAENYALFKQFFDRMVSKNIKIFNFILQDDLESELIFENKDLRVKDKIGRNVLHLTCTLKPKNNILNYIETFVNSGLDLCKDEDNFLSLTPVEYAIKSKNMIVLETLLNYQNFTIDFKQYKNYDSLVYECIRENCHQVLNQFVNYLNINLSKPSTHQMTNLLNFLLYTIEINNTHSMKLLLKINVLNQHLIREKDLDSNVTIFSAVQNATDDVKILFQQLEEKSDTK